MTLLLDIFFTFFKIGLFTFGGGYAMIPIVRDSVVAKGWITEEFFYDFIGVCESTPGPVAINMATFVGSTVAGFWGSFFATLGVVLPSLIVLILVASLFKNFSENPWVKAAFKGMRPVIFSLILSAGLLLALKNLFPVFPTLYPEPGSISVDLKIGALMVFLFAVKIAYKKLSGKKLSPIILIVISAVCGIVIA